MQSVITDFEGLTVILRDEHGERQTLDIFDLCELEEGDK